MCGGSGETGNDGPSKPQAGESGKNGNGDAGAGDTGGKVGTGGDKNGDGGTGGPVECAKGTADCDDDPSDCEADLTAVTTCGTCTNDCTADNSMAKCTNGRCSIGKCDDGFDDCDGDASNGCETALDSADDCGSCGNRCSGDQTCEAGRCSGIECPTGMGNCDNDSSNGCETHLNTLEDCGMCNRPCTLDNATATCDDGTCKIDDCDAKWGDCNTDQRDGCEAPLTTLGNCSECGKPCANDNSESSCETGTCTWVGCEKGFKDCNTDIPTDGCETPVDTVTNCGECGTPCVIPHAQSACNPSGNTYACGFKACDANWVDVNSNLQSDGCECHDVPEDAGTDCQTSKDLGSLTSSGATSLFEVVGTIPVPTRSDWYRIAIPGNRTAAGFSIKFTPATSNLFRFEVVKGCGLGTYACQEAAQTSTGITSWEFKDTCGNSCTTQNETLPNIAYIRVYRTGAALSCDQYTLQFSRG